MNSARVRSLVYLAGGIGLLVSIFAALEFFYASLQGACSVSAFFSCAAVNGSGKTTTLGVQDYLWGIGGFIAILVVAGVAESRPRETVWAYGLAAITTAGVGLSLYFLYLELAEIHAVCLVCATAYLLGGIAWVGAIALALRVRGASVNGVDTPVEPPPQEAD